MSSSPRFSPAECDTLYRIMRARRDMRHFLPDTRVDAAVLQRLLQAAHSAPSVGLMQPWRFIRIGDADLRTQIAALVEVERQNTAQEMGERAAEFLQVKIEGLRDWDGAATARQCQVPVLHIAAAYPTCSPAALAEAIPHAVTGQTVGAGHFNMLEVPDQVNAMIEQFLRHYVP